MTISQKILKGYRVCHLGSVIHIVLLMELEQAECSRNLYWDYCEIVKLVVKRIGVFGWEECLFWLSILYL
jgi:hypothetical protein